MSNIAVVLFFSTGSTAPLGPGLWFSVSWSFYRREDSLDEWWTRRKASTRTQDNTKTE
jgi:hypothetical protein